MRRMLFRLATFVWCALSIPVSFGVTDPLALPLFVLPFAAILWLDV